MSATIDPLLTYKEVAERYRVTRHYVWELKKRGDLPFVQLGRRVLFRSSDVETLIRNNASR